MGRVVCAAIAEDPELELVAAVGRRNAGRPLSDFVDKGANGLRVSDRLESLTEAKATVVADFTTPDAVMANARFYADHHLHAVIGTTGILPSHVDEMRAMVSKNGTNFVVAP